MTDGTANYFVLSPPTSASNNDYSLWSFVWVCENEDECEDQCTLEEDDV